MTRQEKFQEFLNAWEKVKEIMEDEEDDLHLIQEGSELIRFKKMFGSFNTLIQSIDPDVFPLFSTPILTIPEKLIDIIIGYANQCVEDLEAFEITKANKTIDILYTYIAPYTTSIIPPTNNTLNTAAHHIIEKYDNMFQVYVEAQQDIKKELENLKNKYEEEIITADIRAKDFIKRYKETEPRFDEIMAIHKDVFGDNDTNPTGLKQEIEKRLQEIDDVKKKQEETHNALDVEINKRLQGATSVELAKKYSDLADEHKSSSSNFTRYFIGSLVILCVVHCVIYNFIPIQTGDSILAFLISLAVHAALSVPFLWLILFCSRRRSEEKRLYEEYAHKEAITITYTGFKKQVEALGESDSDETLKKKLLNIALDAIAYNASKTLDKKHDDQIPLQNLLEKIIKKLNLNIDITNKEK
jgi:hypothetical protein